MWRMVHDWKGVTAPTWHCFFFFSLQLKLMFDHLFFFKILHQVPAIIKAGKSVVVWWVPGYTGSTSKESTDAAAKKAVLQ
jgi:hypothetical protein